ncbi:hypothetical protein K488DRAFT_87047 [Vararia minispora EC-137]|uniref:Uncharacterized protein n=1 Tax=Vararia minispora EC-137 TaxID=1314806 RepID=A0ACB8QIR5_9AGAM|nr:hypothetical protein K488DRAFT_87047 [Vararia minispora EC-137]
MARPLRRAFSAESSFTLPLFFRAIDHTQRTDSDRDLQDILVEVFGEYGKVLMRAVREDIHGGLFSDGAWGDNTLGTSMQFTRFGVPMTQEKLAIADVLITEIVKRGATLDFVVSIGVLHTLVTYYVLDHALPLPASLDRKTFWIVVSEMIHGLEPAGSKYTSVLVPPGTMHWELPEDTGSLPPAVFRDVFADPSGQLAALYMCLRPRTGGAAPRAPEVLPTFDVFVGLAPQGAAASFVLSDVEFFATKRRPEVEEEGVAGVQDETERGAHTLLDAAVCWAHLWAGHAVRFVVADAALVDVVNGHATRRRPAIDLLHALGRRFGFEPCAALGPAGMEGLEKVQRLAVLGTTAFHRCGACVQAMDALLLDAQAAMERDGKTFDGSGTGVWLGGYQRAIVDTLNKMESNTYEPGAVYRKMRDEQGKRRPGIAPGAGLFKPSAGAGVVKMTRFRRWKDSVDRKIPLRAGAVDDPTNGDTIGARLTFDPKILDGDKYLHGEESRMLARDADVQVYS